MEKSRESSEKSEKKQKTECKVAIRKRKIKNKKQRMEQLVYKESTKLFEDYTIDYFSDNEYSDSDYFSDNEYFDSDNYLIYKQYDSCLKTDPYLIHGYWENTKNIKPLHSYPVSICRCYERRHLRRIQINIEAFRSYLICLNRTKNKQKHQLLLLIFKKYMFPFLFEGSSLQYFLKFEFAYYKKHFELKFNKNLDKIKEYSLKYKLNISVYNTYAYMLLKMKKIFSLYEWKTFNDRLFNVFPRKIIFRRKNVW